MSQMTQAARVRRGGWTYVGLVAVAVSIFAAVNVASAPGGGTVPTAAPSPSEEPIVPAVTPIGATRLAPRTVRGAGPYCERATCCPTRVATFGTAADITKVIGAFQGRGYRYAAPPLIAPGGGDPKTSGSYVRWLGQLPGDARTWRQVNVATGPVAGRPAWTSVYEVAQPRCTGKDAPALPPEDWPRH